MSEDGNQGPPPEPTQTIAGRLIPLAEAAHRAFEKARGQVVGEPQLSADIPAWCHHIMDQLAKTIFKRIVNLDPKGKFNARDYGRMVGLLLRAGVFVFKEAEVILRSEGLLSLTEEQNTKLERHAGIELLFPIASKNFGCPIANEEDLGNAASAHLEKRAEALLHGGKIILRYLLEQPIEQQHEFLSGIPEGFILLLGTDGDFSGDRGRTRLYIDLLVLWPEIAEFENANPPKTRRDLQTWLIKEARVLNHDDEQWFDHFCDEIKLSLKSPGRPRRSAV